jgi:hypothetical protein
LVVQIRQFLLGHYFDQDLQEAYQNHISTYLEFGLEITTPERIRVIIFDASFARFAAALKSRLKMIIGSKKIISDLIERLTPYSNFAAATGIKVPKHIMRRITSASITGI